ncbi:hypothetical protein NPIL_644691 [Nephila pilipes]|uniref:C2H2-type domain-containing protein n=1 Tax=Nephila pilipes TaxID=299642 RepID=A0A8X6NA64_NEPPI|nr:hypothetical protein NPIL_644691 [Nephila pilipes]
MEFPVFDLFYPDIKERRPLCPYCGKSFTYRHLLEWHFQRLHRKKGDLFICSICNEAIINKSDFMSHVREHMRNQWLFRSLRHVCEICGAYFKEDFDLKFHQLTHSKKAKHFNRESLNGSSACSNNEIEVGVLEESCRGCFTKRSFSLRHSKKKFGNPWTLSL